MLNFDFRGSGKRCSKSGRLLVPGEEFYSVLIEDGDDSKRLDFAAEAWTGPPENCVGWWKTKIEPLGTNRVYWASRSHLLAWFDQVRQQPHQADLAYVTALLLAQRRILVTKESLEEPDQCVLYLENKRDKIHYEIPIVDISPDRLMEIQNELSEELFTDQPHATDDQQESEADAE